MEYQNYTFLIINNSFSDGDSPYTTSFRLQDGASGKTNVSALVVFDDVSNAKASRFICGCIVSDASRPETLVKVRHLQD